MARVTKKAEDLEAVQTAQGTAQDTPEAAGGTDTATAAEGQQDAPQAAQDTPQAAEAEKLVYVGPQLPRGLLKTNKIFEGTRDQILASPEMAEVLKICWCPCRNWRKQSRRLRRAGTPCISSTRTLLPWQLRKDWRDNRWR